MDLPAGTRVRTVSTASTVTVDCVSYKVDTHRAFERVLVVAAGDAIIITDLLGEVLAEHAKTAPGTTYVGNGRPRGGRPKPQKRHQMS